MEILDRINSITTSSLTEQVVQRLGDLGYELVSGDEWSVAFAIQKVENSIKNDCYVDEIPNGLISHAVDMACGEFLSGKYTTGQLNIDTLDLDDAIKTVKLGDTSVTLDETTDSAKLNMLISSLCNSGKGEFACYRKIRW